MNDQQATTLGSLFDGIGGFPLAAARNNIKTLWTSDIEPSCESVTGVHFPEAIQLGDITKNKAPDYAAAYHEMLRQARERAMDAQNDQ